jgi:hypothetical protein
MMVKELPVAAALLLLLAACGGAKEEAEDGAARSPGSPAPAAPVATTASGAPKRADGRWELRNVGSGGTVIGTQFLCVDAASEEKASLFDQIARNANCSKYDIASADGGWKFEFVCGGGGMTSTSKGAVTGDFASAYKVEMTESDGTVEMGRTIEAKHAGDCPAGTTPGTLTDENGKVIADVTQ